MQLLAAAELASAGKSCSKCGMAAHIGACSMKAGIRENMEDHPKGGLKCKLCGARAAHPRAAAAHLAVHHKGSLD